MRTAFVSFMFISTFSSVAFAQEESEPAETVLVLGLHSPDGDDRVAGTVSETLRVIADNRVGWTHSVSDGRVRDVTLAQMGLAHGCEDQINRGCLRGIGETFHGTDPSLSKIIFGQMRRRGVGADDVIIELLLFDLAERRVTHRIRLDVTLSDLIIRGSVGDEASGWIERLVSDESRFEDLGEIYFAWSTLVEGSSSANPHATLEIAGASLLGFAGVSLIAAIVTGSMTLGLNGDPQFATYRSSWDAVSVSNVCDRAAADMSPEGRHAVGICNDAGILEALVPLFWTLTGLAAVSGTFLVWHPWSGPDEPPNGPTVSLSPTISPTRFELTLDVVF